MTPSHPTRSRAARIRSAPFLIALVALAAIGLAVPGGTSAATKCVTFAGDATGRQDVTSSLTSFIRTHNGQSICLKYHGKYRIDGIVRLNSLNKVTLDGRYATLKPTAASAVGGNRRQIYILTSTNITLKNLHIVGSNPNAARWVEPRQHEPGIWIDGGRNIKILNSSIRNTYGDGIKLGFKDGVIAPASNIVMDKLTIQRVGRNGISIVAGSSIVVSRSLITDTSLSGVDLEPDYASANIHHITVKTTTFQRIGLSGAYTAWAFAANGVIGSMHDLAVLSNVGDRFQTTVEAKSGQMHRAIVFRSNRSIKAGHAYFGNVVGLSAAGNANITIHTANVR